MTPGGTEPEAGEASLLGPTVPDWLQRSVHVIPGDGQLAYRDEPWRDALAVLEHGRVELETAQGARLRLAEGGVFCRHHQRNLDAARSPERRTHLNRKETTSWT